MTAHFEDLPSELLLHILAYMNPRHIFNAFWNLNSRINNLLTTVNHLHLIVDKEENKEMIALLAPHVRLLQVNTWDEIDLHGFCNLHLLTLTRPSPTQLKQIGADTMPQLTYLWLCSNMYSSSPKQLIYDVFSNRFSRLRWARFGHIDLFDPLYWSQSFSLYYLHFDCYHPAIIPFILKSCPNLDYLHVDFLRYDDKIMLPPSIINNHPLRRFILRDFCHFTSYEDISTLITYIPNTTKIELKFSCDVPFISLAQYLSDHLTHLHQFDCDITECPIDSSTSLTTIRQVHPCFSRIACRTQGVNFRILHTKP